VVQLHASESRRITEVKKEDVEIKRQNKERRNKSEEN
jgi:hypothetical protein